MDDKTRLILVYCQKTQINRKIISKSCLYRILRKFKFIGKLAGGLKELRNFTKQSIAKIYALKFFPFQ